MKRSFLSVAAVVSIVGASSSGVRADVPPGERAGSPSSLWSSLPTASLSHVPSSRSAPTQLARGEHADGVWVVRPKWLQTSKETPNASVVGSKVLADELAIGQSTQRDNEWCVGTTSMPAVVDDNQAREWSSGMPSQAMISWQAPRSSDNAWTITHRPLRVTAVHLERLVNHDDGSASLEYRDAWADPVTVSSRLIGSGALHLARVATGPGGLVVYAARDEDVVHVVVQPGPPPSKEATLRSITRNLTALANFGSSDCGFLRATIPADDAEMATFTTSVITAVTLPAPATDGPPGRPRTARRRGLLVFASATNSSADREPVLSVTFGWGGREEEFQF
jgi:hypothetical protein